MRKIKWSFLATAVVALFLAASLALPLIQGLSPIDFGLDLTGGVAVTYRPDFSKRLDIYQDATEDELLALAKETLTSRLYRNLNTIPDVVIRGDQSIVVSIPSGEDQRKILELVGKTYHLTLRLVTGSHLLPTAGGPVEGKPLFPYQGKHLELAEAEFSGDMLDERHIRVEIPATDALDPAELRPKVAFRFQPPFDEAFGKFTGDHVGRELAILLDDHIEWVGVIESAITDSGVLAGNYTLDEANEIATLLKSGTLPISLEVESLTAVGPTLGQEIQDLGLQSLLLSLLMLTALISMAYLHRSALLIAGVTSLFCLLFLIVGMAAAFDLTLDMVGIAGIVLSVGMGMDAFIIVFEALESRSKNLTPGQLKVHHERIAKRMYSFSSEGRTLFHANATTLVVIALLLATERLRSFALFMFVGLTASVLTIFITRGVLRQTYGVVPDFGPDVMAWLRRFRPRVFRFRKPYFAVVALALCLTGLILVGALPGGPSLELGADFRPGTQVTLTATDPAMVDAALAELGSRYSDLPIRRQNLGDPALGRHLVTLGTAIDTRLETAIDTQLETDIDKSDVKQRLNANEITDIFAAESIQVEKLGSIDNRVSGNRLAKSLSVFLLSFFFLAVYFVIFQQRINRFFGARLRATSSSAHLWIFGGILLAVAVDVSLVLASLALLAIPLSLPVIAALLTIVGYSVNDSVVLWSHIEKRDQSSEAEPLSSLDLVTRSVDRILSRACLTSLSTLVPALTILTVGLDPLRDFAWVMIVGTLAGTLSSMFIVGSFAVRALDRRPQKQIREIPDDRDSPISRYPTVVR